MKNIVILYHADCSDGFGGAWAAWKKFGNHADYIPVYHHNPPLTGLRGKEIYMIDFTYNEPVIRKMLKENKRVTSIDHHISQEKAVKLTEKYSYAVNCSGSVLAWKYFHPKTNVPILLRYIEDGDLWKFKIPRTKEVYAALALIKCNFRAWDALARELQNGAKRKRFIEKGKLLLRAEEELVKDIARNCEEVKFAGHRALAVNSPILPSQLGAVLDKKAPIAIIWSERGGIINVSLRSNGKPDVSKIAKKLGGGGHKASAGFDFKAGKPFPWKLIVKNK
jgi:oligoribonuclease NrnB/cAMP/cGMP phosphodiesterase (DHH superfamily)